MEYVDQHHLVDLSLGPHVWLAEPSDCPAELDWLDQDERTRYDRFTVVAGRERFLLSHCFVRLVLSTYVPALAESDWRFDKGPHGRPEISMGLRDAVPTIGRLRFNLSHTDDLYALIVSDGGDCGVDVETTTRSTDLVSVGRRSFAALEFSDFERLDRPAQRQRFFEYWTLKESYIKAIGTGLATPLKDFWFDLSSPVVSISFTDVRMEGANDAEPGPDPAGSHKSGRLAPLPDGRSQNWAFGLEGLSASHQLAWALGSNEYDGTWPPMACVHWLSGAVSAAPGSV